MLFVFDRLFGLISWRFSTSRRQVLSAVILIFACTACGVVQRSEPSQSNLDPDRPTQVIRHALGQSEIPLDPERVVILFPGIDFDNLLALGIKPVGVATYTADRLYALPGYLQDQVEGIELVGSISQPSLEKITLLDPDLIITLAFHEDIYDQLSQIAPTVVLNATDRSISDRLRKLGEIVNRSETAEQLIQEFEQRVADFRAVMGDRLDEVEVSVLRVRADGIFGYVKSSPTGVILEEIGIKRPPAQDRYRLLGTRIDISLEKLEDADGDVIFVWGALKGDEEAREQLFANSLWQQLDGVQRGNVYVVPEEHWAFPGIQGVHLMIDDLYRYVVDQEPPSTHSES